MICDPEIRRFFQIALVVAVLVLWNSGGRPVVEKINFQLWREHENFLL